MKILATLRIGNEQTTQAWELMTGDSQDFLKIATLPDGKEIILKLQKRKIIDLKGSEIAENLYPGVIEITDAIIVPSDSD